MIWAIEEGVPRSRNVRTAIASAAAAAIKITIILEIPMAVIITIYGKDHAIF